MTQKSKILLHICCAPDATAVFERLQPEFQVVGYFQNSNIHPEAEYVKRFEQAEKVAAAMGFELIAGTYAPEAWCQAVRGLETEPERGRRCEVCYALNLQATAAKARLLGIPAFTSTLTVSPHKPYAEIIAAGRAAAKAGGVEFVERDFKKQDGFKRSLVLSRELGLYRQNYCGCRFSWQGGKHA